MRFWLAPANFRCLETTYEQWGTEFSCRKEYSATILNRTLIGYAFIEPVLLFENILKRLKEGEEPTAVHMLAYVYRPAVIIRQHD